MSGPKVYGVTYDGETRIVIAPTFGDAVELWLMEMQGEWGDDWTGDEQPEQVVLISDEPVIGVELEMERRRQIGVVVGALIDKSIDEHRKAQQQGVDNAKRQLARTTP